MNSGQFSFRLRSGNDQLFAIKYGFDQHSECRARLRAASTLQPISDVDSVSRWPLFNPAGDPERAIIKPTAKSEATPFKGISGAA